jgi:hypothetical protein
VHDNQIYISGKGCGYSKRNGESYVVDDSWSEAAPGLSLSMAFLGGL